MRFIMRQNGRIAISGEASLVAVSEIVAKAVEHVCK